MNAPAAAETATDSPTVGGIFTGLQGYRDATCHLITHTQTVLLVFDDNLQDTGLEASETAEALSQLCQRTLYRPCVRILLRKMDSLHSNAPRLLRLMTYLGTHIELRVIDEDYPLPPSMQAPFAVSDGRSIVTRFHYESLRGKYLLDDRQAAHRLADRFEEHWMRAQHGPAVTTLGL